MTIVQKDNEILRQTAKEVPLDQIGSAQFQDIISRMKTALDSQDDGVAIAAPQIAEPWRIFLVSGKVFVPNYPDIEPDEKIPDDMVFINPEITKLSREKEKMPEGCLSVRWLYGNVMRSTKANIKAVDEKGTPFTRGASGLLAQIFQHEVDHLNGILFIDKAEDLEEMTPEQQHKHAHE